MHKELNRSGCSISSARINGFKAWRLLGPVAFVFLQLWSVKVNMYIYIQRERERDIIDINVNKYYTIYVYTIHSTVNEAFNEQLSARGC